MVEYRILELWPAYRVGDDGSIWTQWRKGPRHNAESNYADWRELRPTIDKDGYRRIDLHSIEGYRRTRKVSVLVCEAFHGEAQPGEVCRHRNGNSQDDRASNLVWGTTQENTDDRREHGTIAKGDGHGKTKLSQSEIDSLLALKGTITQKAAADRFGVSRGYVGQLWSGARKRVTV